MPIIQIRDVPEETYETIRRRARSSGQSIQGYMLTHLVEFAGRPTPGEVVAEIRADRVGRRKSDITTQDVLDALDYRR